MNTKEIEKDSGRLELIAMFNGIQAERAKPNFSETHPSLYKDAWAVRIKTLLQTLVSNKQNLRLLNLREKENELAIINKKSVLKFMIEEWIDNKLNPRNICERGIGLVSLNRTQKIGYKLIADLKPVVKEINNDWQGICELEFFPIPAKDLLMLFIRPNI